MASKLIFDPQTLIDEEKENEQKKVKEIISAQEAYDQLLEEENAKVRKQSDIQKSISKADRAIREVIYANTYGWGAWSEAKKKEDSNTWNEWQDNTLLGKMFKTDKSKTLEEEYGDGDEIKPQLASYMLDGTTGPIESQSTVDPFGGETGQIESITHGFISGAIKIPYGFMNLGAMLIDFANKEKFKVYNISKKNDLNLLESKKYKENIMKRKSLYAQLQSQLGSLEETLKDKEGMLRSFAKIGSG